MVHSSTLAITTDGEHLMDGGFSLSEVVHVGSLEFSTGHFDNLNLSPKGSDSGAVFVGMAQSGSPSLHAILEESVSEYDSTTSEGGKLWLPRLSGLPHGDLGRSHYNHYLACWRAL
jgi:hypothetical protein